MKKSLGKLVCPWPRMYFSKFAAISCWHGHQVPVEFIHIFHSHLMYTFASLLRRNMINLKPKSVRILCGKCGISVVENVRQSVPVVDAIDLLTHWGRDKMTAISQTTFANAFSSMKMYEFRLKFHWSLFLRASWYMIILSEPILVRSLTHICVTRPQWVDICTWFVVYVLSWSDCEVSVDTCGTFTNVLRYFAGASDCKAFLKDLGKISVPNHN